VNPSPMKSSIRMKKPARTKLLDDELNVIQIAPESRRRAACVLEVLAGLRTPEQAAEVLNVSLPTYYNLETRALRGLIYACTPQPPGRTMALMSKLGGMEQKCASLEKQVQRYQALLRNAQRTAGLLPPVESRSKPGAKRKAKKPSVRALRAIESLNRSPDSPADVTTPVVSSSAIVEPVTIASEISSSV